MNIIEIAYFTDKVQEMSAFYQRLLGSEPVAHSENMSIFMLGSTKIFIHKNYAPGAGDLPPDNHIALAVEEVDSTYHNLVRLGLKLEMAPQDYYWGRSAYLRDPDDHLIEVTKGEPQQG